MGPVSGQGHNPGADRGLSTPLFWKAAVISEIQEPGTGFHSQQEGKGRTKDVLGCRCGIRGAGPFLKQDIRHGQALDFLLYFSVYLNYVPQLEAPYHFFPSL